MKLSEMISRYNLHDSIVEDVKFLYDIRKLTIDIELCYWKQDSYEEGDPEMISGKLVFHGVENYEIGSSNSVSFESNEILKTEVTHVSDNIEKIKMVLSGSDDVKVIIIKASNVEWISSENA